METRTGRFRRTQQFTQTWRGLRGEILALRFELELLAEDLGPAPEPARIALDDAFVSLRAAEHAWLQMCRPADLGLVVAQIDAARDALEASLAARAR